MKKKAIITVSATVLVLITAAAGMAAYAYRLISSPMGLTEDQLIYIYPTDGTESIISQIKSTTPANPMKGLDLLMKLKGDEFSPKPGSYILKSDATPRQIYNLIQSGSQTPVRITINTVRNIERMARQIGTQLMTDSAAVASLLTDQNFIEKLGFTPATVFTMIIPNTYEVYWTITPEELLTRLAKEKDAFWNDTRKAQAKAIGLTPLEVMTLASIVEEETAKADEMPMVAGLYMNRINKGMKLQADPTVIFALGGERPKRVLNVHLQVESPYNTYLHAGLPPAPIRFTGPTSINAVLNYTHHNYIFMCAKEDFSGYHNFAETYSKHLQNARRYQRELTNRNK